jgi:hypothetical protein
MALRSGFAIIDWRSRRVENSERTAVRNRRTVKAGAVPDIAIGQSP